MAIRTIVKNGDPVLRKVCRPVTDFGEKLHTVLDDMAETMHAADGVGLAGPQVSYLRRVVVIDVGEGVIELINPEITWRSDETQYVQLPFMPEPVGNDHPPEAREIQGAEQKRRMVRDGGGRPLRAGGMPRTGSLRGQAFRRHS